MDQITVTQLILFPTFSFCCGLPFHVMYVHDLFKMSYGASSIYIANQSTLSTVTPIMAVTQAAQFLRSTPSCNARN